MDLNFDQESDDSLMSQIIHDVGKNGTLKRKERRSIRKIFDYEADPTKTIDDSASSSGTISEIESIQDESEEIPEIKEMKFESLDNLLIQQDQEQFEKTLPPPVPIKSDETILKVKRARKSRLEREYIPIPEESSLISDTTTIIGPGPVEPNTEPSISQIQQPSGIGENVKLINTEEKVLIAHKIEAVNEEVIDEAGSDSDSKKVKGCACARRRKIDWMTNPFPRWKKLITNFYHKHRRSDSRDSSQQSSIFEKINFDEMQKLQAQNKN